MTIALYVVAAARTGSGSPDRRNTAMRILRGVPGFDAAPAQWVMLPSKEYQRFPDAFMLIMRPSSVRSVVMPFVSSTASRVIKTFR